MCNIFERKFNNTKGREKCWRIVHKWCTISFVLVASIFEWLKWRILPCRLYRKKKNVKVFLKDVGGSTKQNSINHRHPFTFKFHYSRKERKKKKTFLLNLFLARRLVPFCLHNLDPRRAGFWRMGRNSGHLFVLHWRLHFIGLCCSCADHLVPRLL